MIGFTRYTCYNLRNLVAALMGIVLTLSLVSCGPQKKITYFRDIPDSSAAPLPNIPVAIFKDPVIKASDLLQVSIITLDPQENASMAGSTPSFQMGATGGVSMPSQTVQGFMVDKSGTIELPIVGRIKVEGLTTAVARDSIYNRVAVFYKNPVVNVRFANFQVTVLGEVSRPGTYTVSNEKVGVLDAIGMAGDLTIYGKRENVLLIRDSSNNKKIARLDLTSSKMLQSPYYYLEPGDVLYIEPSKAKIASTDAARTRTYTLIASAFTVLIVLLTRL